MRSRCWMDKGDGRGVVVKRDNLAVQHTHSVGRPLVTLERKTGQSRLRPYVSPPLARLAWPVI